MLERFIQYIEAEKRFSPLTVRNYRRDIERFIHWCEHEAPEQVQTTEEGDEQGEDEPQTLRIYPFRVERVKARHLREWLLVRSQNRAAHKRGTLTTGSLNREISSLKSFFRYLHRLKLIESNPMQGIRTLKAPKRLPSFVPESRMQRLLIEGGEVQPTEDEGGYFLQVRNHLVVELFYGCGLRLAELIGIDLEDFSDDYRTLRVVGKGSKERQIPIIEELRSDILAYISLIDGQKICKNEKNALILTQKGERISRITAYRIVKNALDEGGVQGKRSPHVLRHTFATHLLNHGADMREIQELMGHSSLQATQIYTHNSIAQLQEIYQKAHPREGKKG